MQLQQNKPDIMRRHTCYWHTTVSDYPVASHLNDVIAICLLLYGATEQNCLLQLGHSSDTGGARRGPGLHCLLCGVSNKQLNIAESLCQAVDETSYLQAPEPAQGA